MSYKGDELVDLVDHLRDVSMKTGRRLAEKMQERGEQNITQNTPVATFHLRKSYKRTPIIYQSNAKIRLHKDGSHTVRWSAFAWEGRVFTEVEYAPYVELGTGLWGPKRKKYKIAPKKPGGVLAFSPYTRMPNGGVILDVQGAPVQGKLITVRFVMHPGSPGQHMFKIGTTLTEAEYREWSMEPMRLWKREVESRVARGQLAGVS